MRLSQIERIAPLSPVQQGLLFHALAEPHAGSYVEHAVARLDGRLDVDAFRQTWQFLLARHDALRAAFLWRGLEHPVQIFYRDVSLDLTHADASAPTTIENWIRDRVREHAGLAGALSDPPLMRMALARVSDAEHHFVWSIHHLIHDAWSLSILLNELMIVYDALASGRMPQLPAAGSYADFVASTSASARSSSDAERFWRQTHDGYTPPVAMPADESIADGGAERHERRARALTADDDTRIEKSAREAGLTLNTYAVAAWALVLADRENRRDVMFGATAAGRPAGYAQIDRTVGVFINTLPFRVRLDSQAVVGAWLRTLQRQQLEIVEHEATPLADIRAWMAYPRQQPPQQQPLFESILVCQNALERFEGRSMGNVRIATVSSTGHPHYPLMFRVTPGSPGTPTLLEIVFDTARIDAASADRLLDRVHAALQRLPHAFDMRVVDLLHALTRRAIAIAPPHAGASIASALGGVRRKPVARVTRVPGEVHS